ncbi:MAG: hypothetical protein GY913_21000 [Proteobacteria bacterium]|nr:hypothetical protein [Pseudomonadota bacterium]MCP4919386.1 hypothetical protein [Pseudomonadota bacterium]
MAGLIGGFGDQSGWNVYFTKMVKGCADRAALVDLHARVAVPMRYWLGYHLVALGELTTDSLDPGALEAVCQHEADGTNWHVNHVFEVFGDAAGPALA